MQNPLPFTGAEKKSKKSAPQGPIQWLNRCYGYIRVSTKKQQNEGVSLDNQKKNIEAWALINKHEIVDILADKGISGTTIEKRPGFMKIFNILQPGETLVAYSFSRLSRTTRDCLNILHALDARGCRVVIITENLDTSTAMGQFATVMMSAVAELEVRMIKGRVKDSMDFKKSKGEFVGRPPYGWKQTGGKGSGLEKVPEQQAIIERIKIMRTTFTEEGKQLSYEKIAAVLNDEKIKPPGKGAYWTHSSVSRVFKQKDVKTKGRSPGRQRKGYIPSAEKEEDSSSEEGVDKVSK